MAKFGRWGDFGSLARDLKRGIYNLTFKDNMPDEPVAKKWNTTALSPSGGTFTLTEREAPAGDPNQEQQYALIGNRCFFRLRCNLTVSGTAQQYFWIRLPAPAKSNNSWGFGRFHGVTSQRSIFVDLNIGSPSGWWVALQALSETATAGAWPRESGILLLEGSYEVHPQWLRSGTYSENEAAFGAVAGSNFISFAAAANIRTSPSVAKTVVNTNFYYMALGDYEIVEFDTAVTVNAIGGSYFEFTLPRTAKTISSAGSRQIIKPAVGFFIDSTSVSGYIDAYVTEGTTSCLLVLQGLGGVLVNGRTYTMYGEVKYPTEP